MKKLKMFLACDTTNITKVKNWAKENQNVDASTELIKIV